MTTTTGIGVHDQNLEKHMGGCMAGFFHIFDRSHLLTSKRSSPKPLPPPKTADSSSELVSSVGSPALSIELQTPKTQPKPELPSPATSEPPKSPMAVSTFEFKDGVKSPWKFSREAPRLSLDSRAVVDAKGGLRPREIKISAAAGGGDDGRENQKRSPSVVARLMGLDRLPSSAGGSEPEKTMELRRSASESRSRDYRFFDAPSFLSPKTELTGERKADQTVIINNVARSGNPKAKNMNLNQRRSMAERKSYYDTADFFPPDIPAKYQQQQNQAVTIYGEIERRLRMRGMDQPSKDLETLKHILEALQLKGLLHSSTPTTKSRRRFEEERNSQSQSPIVLMKPARSPAPVNRRRVSTGETAVSPRRERPARSPVRSPGRSDSRNSSPLIRRKGGPLSVETQKKVNETTTTTTRALNSPVQSPRLMSRKSVVQTVNRIPRNRRSTVEIEDEVSTVSESSFGNSSRTDNERWRGDECRDGGRNLLERCDKLLSSIAEMTSNSNSNSNSTELQQPSPVSVLDPSFYKEDESSPSPVKKHTIHFKDQVLMELEDELWSPSSSTQLLSKHDHDIDLLDDSDFSYVSEVLRASYYPPKDADLFLLLEKHNSVRAKDRSKPSILQRKLIFDTITEILDRNRQLPPWKAVLVANWGLGRPMLDQIWSEFRKIRERDSSEDLFGVICGVLKKDLAGDSINGWGDCHVEMAEAVLDIERMIYKDLIGETIGDLAGFARKREGTQAYRRKLVF